MALLTSVSDIPLGILEKALGETPRGAFHGLMMEPRGLTEGCPASVVCVDVLDLVFSRSSRAFSNSLSSSSWLFLQPFCVFLLPWLLPPVIRIGCFRLH